MPKVTRTDEFESVRERLRNKEKLDYKQIELLGHHLERLELWDIALLYAQVAANLGSFFRAREAQEHSFTKLCERLEEKLEPYLPC
jgi:hypothetical protein